MYYTCADFNILYLEDICKWRCKDILQPLVEHFCFVQVWGFPARCYIYLISSVILLCCPIHVLSFSDTSLPLVSALAPLWPPMFPYEKAGKNVNRCYGSKQFMRDTPSISIFILANKIQTQVSTSC